MSRAMEARLHIVLTNAVVERGHQRKTWRLTSHLRLCASGAPALRDSRFRSASLHSSGRRKCSNITRSDLAPLADSAET